MRFRVLVIEDETRSSEALAWLLEREFQGRKLDYDVVQADSRKTAREHIKKGGFDLIVSDLKLPEDLNGSAEDYEPEFSKDFFKHFWHERNRTAVILMTAYDDQEDVSSYFEALDEFGDWHYRKHVKRIKDGVPYTERIRDDCRDILYGGFVLERLHAIYYSPGERWERQYLLPAHVDATTLLDSLHEDIRNFWAVLKDESRNKIREFVNVELDDEGAVARVDLHLRNRSVVTDLFSDDHPGERLEDTTIALYFRERDPWPGPGEGRAGVISTASLLDGYRSGLKAGWDFLTAERSPLDHPIKVYIMDLSRLHLRWRPQPQLLACFPFALTDLREIFFSSRSVELDTDFAYRRAQIEAIHELAHFFNARRRFLGGWWPAVDEATAVFTEWAVYRGNRWTLSLAADWLDRPEISLFAENGGSRDWIFLQFVESRDPGFVSRLWTQQPVSGLIQEWFDLLGKNCEAVLAEYFALGYFADHICEGLGKVHSYLRACAESQVLDRSHRDATWKGQVASLACAYCRIRVPENGTLRLTVVQGGASLKVLVNYCDIFWKPVSADVNLKSGVLELPSVPAHASGKIDHIVVCVANVEVSIRRTRTAFQLAFEWYE